MVYALGTRFPAAETHVTLFSTGPFRPYPPGRYPVTGLGRRCSGRPFLDKGYCLTRSSYDSDFNNDTYCWDWRNERWHTGQCHWADTSDFEDKISSFDNDTDNWWKFYEDRKYGGYVLCIRPRGYDADIGNNTSMEDDISSIKKFGTSKPGGCDKTIG